MKTQKILLNSNEITILTQETNSNFSPAGRHIHRHVPEVRHNVAVADPAPVAQRWRWGLWRNSSCGTLVSLDFATSLYNSTIPSVYFILFSRIDMFSIGKLFDLCSMGQMHKIPWLTPHQVGLELRILLFTAKFCKMIYFKKIIKRYNSPGNAGPGR